MTHTLATGRIVALSAASSLPPGMGGLTTIAAWVTGLSGFVLFLAFLGSMGKTGVKALAHGQFEGGTSQLVILFCAVGLGAAAAIFGALGLTTA